MSAQLLRWLRSEGAPSLGLQVGTPSNLSADGQCDNVFDAEPRLRLEGSSLPLPLDHFLYARTRHPDRAEYRKTGITACAV